jgi:predicted Ser/Thr protein kinase
VAKRESRQVNIRVEREVYDVLETVRYLRDLRGMQELLEPIVERFASSAAEDERVERALAARRESLSGRTT